MELSLEFDQDLLFYFFVSSMYVFTTFLAIAFNLRECPFLDFLSKYLWPLLYFPPPPLPWVRLRFKIWQSVLLWVLWFLFSSSLQCPWREFFFSNAAPIRLVFAIPVLLGSFQFIPGLFLEPLFIFYCLYRPWRWQMDKRRDHQEWIGRLTYHWEKFFAFIVQLTDFGEVVGCAKSDSWDVSFFPLSCRNFTCD